MKGFTCKKDKKKNRNAGFSLVEVIVSMLILAILIVPMFRMFEVSAKTNHKSRKQQYATTVAQNVLEGLKMFGAEQTAAQFNNQNTDSFFILPSHTLLSPIQGIGYYECEEDENWTKKLTELSSDGTYFYPKNTERKYYYIIKDVKEGTGRFDVKISFNAETYVKKEEEEAVLQNYYEMPDISNLNIITTALIDPNYITDYDTDALLYYQKTNFDYVTELYNIECDAIRERNEHNKHYEDYVEEPIPDPPIEKDADFLKPYINRKTLIYITEVDGSYKVMCKREYVFDQSTLSSDADRLCAEGLSVEDRSAIEQRTYTSLYSGPLFRELKDIYLFHIPLDERWKGDFIQLENEAGVTANVYIVKQEITNDFSSKKTISLESGEGNNSLTIFSNGELRFDENDESIHYNEKLVNRLEAYDRLYQAEISVYEAGAKECLIQLTSSISN